MAERLEAPCVPQLPEPPEDSDDESSGEASEASGGSPTAPPAGRRAAKALASLAALTALAALAALAVRPGAPAAGSYPPALKGETAGYALQPRGRSAASSSVPALNDGDESLGDSAAAAAAAAAAAPFAPEPPGLRTDPALGRGPGAKDSEVLEPPQPQPEPTAEETETQTKTSEVSSASASASASAVGGAESPSRPAQAQAQASPAAPQAAAEAPLLASPAGAAGLGRGPWAAARLWQTARHQGDLLTRQGDVRLVPDFDFTGPVVDIQRGELGQTLVGFGGAFTEASAVVFSQLDSEQQRQVVDGYFGPEGIGYTLGRVHINSCDFSTQSYSFDNVNNDFELWHFDDAVTRDARALIPLILRAQESVGARGERLRLLATPWSPPAWMKVNGQMDHSASPCLRSDAHGVWARYIVRWITAYEARGVRIWAMTVQNEPEFDAQWEACVMTPAEEAKFLGAHLGPELRAAHPDVLVFVYDHNKDHMMHWADAVAADPAAKRHMDGVAFHWYTGDSFEAVREVHRRHPGMLLLPSEATYERRRWSTGARVVDGEWAFGEGYAHDIIGDLNAGAVGWLDWNLLLDQNGGPNHADNECDAAVMADLSTGQIFRHPQYFYIGHFSKFIVPGSKHVNVTVSATQSYAGPPRLYGTCTEEDGLQATAFLRPDGILAVVLLNCGEYIIDFKLRDGKRAALARMPPHSIQTYLL